MKISVKTQTTAQENGLLWFRTEKTLQNFPWLSEAVMRLLFCFEEEVPPLEVLGRVLGKDGEGNWLIRVEKVVTDP